MVLKYKADRVSSKYVQNERHNENFLNKVRYVY